MTDLTNQNLPTTMTVLNEAQLSKDFDSLYLAKGILIFTLPPRVIHNIAYPVVLSIYFAKKTNNVKYQYHVCLFIFDRRTRFGTPRPISVSRNPNDVMEKT